MTKNQMSWMKIIKLIQRSNLLINSCFNLLGYIFNDNIYFITYIS